MDSSSIPSKNLWIAQMPARPQARLRLFCFPYAGGDAFTIYRKWAEALPVAVEVCAVKIPGRGARVAEPSFDNLGLIVKAVSEALADYLDKPFAFFGHSMGALISFELARLFRAKRRMEPCHLFVSGRGAPHIPDRDPPTYNLPEPEFIAELQRINGTPKEALGHPELMKLMLPILKADFQLCQTHVYMDEPPLRCPITVFGGWQDEARREDLEAWARQTTGRCSVHMLPGDHFFIRTEQRAILRLLSAWVLRSVPWQC